MGEEKEMGNRFARTVQRLTVSSIAPAAETGPACLARQVCLALPQARSAPAQLQPPARPAALEMSSKRR